MIKILNKITDLRIIALTGVIIVYYTIISTLNRGISCDEGFYLLGYLQKQPLGGTLCDFQYIVRSLFFFLPDDSVLIFRYIRLILNIIALLLFTWSSFEWIKTRFQFNVSPLLYFILLFLAGAMSFTYAAPTISFDHLQHILYLFVGALLFRVLSCRQNPWQLLYLLSIGFLFVFTLINYLPSGILLVLTIGIILAIENKAKKLISSIVIIFIGFMAGAVFYHFCIHNLFQYVDSVKNSLQIESIGTTQHDSSSLLSAMFMAIGKIILVYVPLIFIIIFVRRRHLLSLYLSFILLIVSILLLLLIRNIYNLKGLLFFSPIAFLFALLLFQKQKSHKQFFTSKEFYLFILFTGIPFMGIFGTNQSIMTKMLLFLPFWMIAFVMLLAQLQNSYGYMCKYITLIFIVMLTGGYLYLGNFSRFQYNYTPRSSKLPLQESTRYRSILISDYQRSYYHDLCDTLKTYGFQKDSKIVAFGENQIAVYIAGGYFHGGLVYTWSQYTQIPKEKARFLILFKGEETSVIKWLTHSRWDFPVSYNRIEFRSMSQNMKEDQYKTIIYYTKQ